MRRASAAAVLLADFLWHVVTAGLAIAWQIVRHGSSLTPVIVRFKYEGLSPTGAVLYASLLSLTPGTTAIDIDLQGQTLLLHVLDGRRARRALAWARRRFETRIQTLFPEARS